MDRYVLKQSKKKTFIFFTDPPCPFTKSMGSKAFSRGFGPCYPVHKSLGVGLLHCEVWECEVEFKVDIIGIRLFCPVNCDSGTFIMGERWMNMHLSWKKDGRSWPSVVHVCFSSEESEELFELPRQAVPREEDMNVLMPYLFFRDARARGQKEVMEDTDFHGKNDLIFGNMYQ